MLKIAAAAVQETCIAAVVQCGHSCLNHYIIILTWLSTDPLHQILKLT